MFLKFLTCFRYSLKDNRTIIKYHSGLKYNLPLSLQRLEWWSLSRKLKCVTDIWIKLIYFPVKVKITVGKFSENLWNNKKPESSVNQSVFYFETYLFGLFNSNKAERLSMLFQKLFVSPKVMTRIKCTVTILQPLDDKQFLYQLN